MQTKPFVVEHKSSRRREPSSTRSLWAGLDLAAVAEKVADDLPEYEDAGVSAKPGAR